MLFVKNMLFLDGAVATLAPDVDLLGEVVEVAGYFATRYGERIAAELGIDPSLAGVDLDGVRAAIGVAAGTERISYRELQARRETVRRKIGRQRRARTATVPEERPGAEPAPGPSQHDEPESGDG